MNEPQGTHHDSPSAEELNRRAIALARDKRFDEAISCFQRAADLRPDVPDAWRNLGTALADAGRFDEAIACYQRVLVLAPNDRQALYSLGNLFEEPAQFDRAIECYRRILWLKPDDLDTLCRLGNVLKMVGRLGESIDCYQKAQAIQPLDPHLHSNWLFTLQFHPDYDAAAILRENRKWNEQHAEALREFIRAHNNDRNPDRRLRIGYISPNFRHQAEAFFLMPLLECSDHERFEIHCYCDVRKPDEITRQFQKHADAWHEIRGWTDEVVDAQIRADRIDILVDLSMHLADNRLLVFARKPAPVQVTWLAYPGTTGLDTIDYRLTDAWLDPPNERAELYSEKSVRLPDCWVCYHPLTDQPPVNDLPALFAGCVTFGCLNNFCKLNDSVLELWSRAMHAVPASRLLLLAPLGEARRRTLQKLAEFGISAERVAFAQGRLRADYLKLYHYIDVALDPLPYNGITTSCDALWMGVPVVSFRGARASGRAGLGILNAAGKSQWAAGETEKFVQIVSELSRDLSALAEIRRNLRSELERSTLMDGPRFARNVESAFRQMWRTYCGADA